MTGRHGRFLRLQAHLCPAAALGSFGNIDHRRGKRMRTAISFWQMPTEEAAFFEFLYSTGPLRARVNRSLPESEELDFRPLSSFRRRNFGGLLICRKCDVEEVPISRYKAQGKFWCTVDPQVSPVLTYYRERLEKRELFQSTLGASLDYVHLRTGERRQKDPEFKKWAKAVVAWMRSRCTESGTA